MAGASSWSEVTEENINFTKLSRLLINGGTFAMRSVFDSIFPPSSLATKLTANIATLQSLRRRRFLNSKQWDKLFPPSANPTSKDFDITLLLVLLRNICGLTPPATGWDTLPPDTDDSREANLARIKYYRNTVYGHAPSTDINNDDFEQYWQDIASSLVALGVNQDDIDSLKSATLGQTDHSHLLPLITDLMKLVSEITNKQDKHVDKLSQADFSGWIEHLCSLRHGSTRKWIIEDVNSFIDSNESIKIMKIIAGPGFGKSVVAAVICDEYKKKKRLAACYFFQFVDSTRNDPKLMLQAVARQLCCSISGFEAILEKKLKTNIGRKTIPEMKIGELFTVLLEDTLYQVKQTPTEPFVIVIDALDECSASSQDKLLSVLNEKAPTLPAWLKLVITSRPSQDRLKLNIDIDSKSEYSVAMNKRDLESYITAELSDVYDRAVLENAVTKCLETSKGLFLVAYYIIDYLKKNKERVRELDISKVFPEGLSSVYDKYFTRLEEVLSPYLRDKGFDKMLAVVVAARRPIPKDLFYDIIGLRVETDDDDRNQRETRREAINLLHTMFPDRTNHVAPFHKTIVDWLKSKRNCNFSVSVPNGHAVLAEQCYDTLSDIREGGKDLNKPLSLTGSERYALRYGLYHMRESPQFKRKKTELTSNCFFISSLICVFGKDTLKVLEKTQTMNHLLVLEKLFPFSPHSNFGHYVSLVLQAASVTKDLKVGDDQLRSLRTNLPHYRVDRPLLELQRTSDKTTKSIIVLKNGFIVGEHINQVRTSLRKFEGHEGFVQIKEIKSKNEVVSGHVDLSISPKQCYTVATTRNTEHKTIQVMKTSMLTQQAGKFVLPRRIKACYVLSGIKRGKTWYMVAWCDQNIYVIERLNRTKLKFGIYKTIPLVPGDELVRVSSLGHILIKPKATGATPKEPYFCSFDKNVETKFSIFVENLRGEKIAKGFHFSQNGQYLAYYNDESIVVVGTQDGVLVGQFSNGLPLRIRCILFLTEDHVLYYSFTEFVIVLVNLRTNVIEDKFLVTQELGELLAVQKNVPLTLLMQNVTPHKYSVSKLVFYNLRKF